MLMMLVVVVVLMVLVSPFGMWMMVVELVRWVSDVIVRGTMDTAMMVLSSWPVVVVV